MRSLGVVAGCLAVAGGITQEMSPPTRLFNAFPGDPGPLRPVHAIMLTDGRILAFGTERSPEGGSSFSPNASVQSVVGGWQLWTAEAPALQSQNVAFTVSGLDTNLFCSGHIVSDSGSGRVLFNGGDRSLVNSIYHGLRLQAEFDPSAVALWTILSSMSRVRWYPSVAALSCGRFLIAGGSGGIGNPINSYSLFGKSYASESVQVVGPARGIEVTSLWPGGHYTSYVPWMLDDNWRYRVENTPQSGIHPLDSSHPFPELAELATSTSNWPSFALSGNNTPWSNDQRQPYWLYYPFLYPIPNGADPAGSLLVAGPSRTARKFDPLRSIFERQATPGLRGTGEFSSYPTAIMLVDGNQAGPPLDIYVSGGGDSAVPDVARLRVDQDGSVAAWQNSIPNTQTTSLQEPLFHMNVGRKNHFMVPLPSWSSDEIGWRLFTVGGNWRETAVFPVPWASSALDRRPWRAPEVFNPATGRWTIFGAQTVNGNLEAIPGHPAVLDMCRVYHNTQMILPCGRVWIAGGDNVENVNWLNWQFNHVMQSFQIFTPPYYSIPNKPVIQSIGPVHAGGAAETFFYDMPIPGAVTYGSGRTASHAVLISLPSVTHGWNFGQRMIKLQPVTDGVTGHIGYRSPIWSAAAMPPLFSAARLLA